MSSTTATLPASRGPLSAAVATCLTGGTAPRAALDGADPLGDDVHLLDRDPDLAADVVFGIQATEVLEERLGAHLLGSWRSGRSALL